MRILLVWKQSRTLDPRFWCEKWEREMNHYISWLVRMLDTDCALPLMTPDLFVDVYRMSSYLCQLSGRSNSRINFWSVCSSVFEKREAKLDLSSIYSRSSKSRIKYQVVIRLTFCNKYFNSDFESKINSIK